MQAREKLILNLAVIIRRKMKRFLRTRVARNSQLKNVKKVLEKEFREFELKSLLILNKTVSFHYF